MGGTRTKAGWNRGCNMCTDALRERFFDVLVSGDRVEARQVVLRALETGDSAIDLITELYWPTYERVEKLYRADHLSKLGHHYATRLLRVLADQTAGLITPTASNGRTVIVTCGPRDSDDLAGQLATDMLVSQGFTVHFGGGGIPNDELLAEVKLRDPAALVMFSSGANDLPFIREFIDTIRTATCRSPWAAVCLIEPRGAPPRSVPTSGAMILLKSSRP